MKNKHWHAFGVALTCLPPLAAHATMDIALRLDANFGQNNNLFRVDASQAPPSAGSTAVATPQIGSATRNQTVDMAVGVPLDSDRTRLILTTSLGRQSYGSRSELDHSPRTLTARLPWHFTDRLEGELSAGSSRSAYGFDDFYPLLDTVNRTWTQASISLLATPSLSIPIQISRQTLRHEDKATHVFLDADTTRLSAAVLYRSPTGSVAQAGFARSETDYPGRATAASPTIPGDRDDDWFWDVSWSLSPITQLSMRWAHRERSFTNASTLARTNLYRLGVSHAWSTQLQWDAQLWRLPSVSTQQGVADGTSTGRRIGVRYTPNEKWDINAAWQKQSDRNQVFDTGAGISPLNPDTTSTTARARYNFDTRLSAYVELAHEKRVRRQTETASQRVYRAGLEYRFENIPGAVNRTRAATLPVF